MSSPENPNLASSAAWSQIAATQPGTVLLRTARSDADNRKSYLFTGALEILSTDQLDELPGLFKAIDRALQAGYYVAGFLSYEAGNHFEPAALQAGGDSAKSGVPLAWFGIYREPAVCDGKESGWPTADTGNEDRPQPGNTSLDLSRAEYAERIQKIRRYIEAGDLYQANFTMSLHQPWDGSADSLFERMMGNQPVPYGALINTGKEHVLSASPELFFRKQGNRITVRPMKGTAGRGRDCEEDARNAAWLAADEKNRAENVMIVDLLRNDLGRICKIGSVEVTDLFAVERHSDLLQMTSTIRGILSPATSYYEIFRSLFPCGSITGAPKIRTMQVIRELEDEPRGIPYGAIGFIAPAGDAVFSVAIRTPVLRDGEAQMRIGSGITYDSDPENEYAECLLKARFLIRNPRHFELIETIAWDKDLLLLDLHLDRLKDSADYFEFRCDLADVRSELSRFTAKLEPDSRQRVRLLLSQSGSLSLTSTPLGIVRDPATILVAAEQTDSSDPFLRHKTTLRSVYDRALANARAAGFDDALLLNERGEVTECAIHNVMIEKNGKRMTPSLECGLLPGVYRRHLLKKHPGIQESVLRLEDVVSADRIFIFNSVRGLRQVQSIRSN